MPESVEIQQVEKRTSAAPLIAGAVVIVLLFAVALYMIFDLRSRVHLLEAGLERQAAETKVVEDKLHLTNKNIEAGMESLAPRLA